LAGAARLELFQTSIILTITNGPACGILLTSLPTVLATGKSTLPSWKDVKTTLLTFDRTGLLGLVQDLYAVSRGNQAFLHARLGLGPDPLAPFKASISRWINPDLMRNQRVSVSNAKKAVADYKKAIGEPDGLAELSIFYCEEAFSFAESCSYDDERYFVALTRMYARSVQFVLDLPAINRRGYAKRLESLKSRARYLGWGVEENVEMLWYDSDLDECQSE
jgi:hypothetical protein